MVDFSMQGAGSGAVSGATAGSAAGPWGAAIGGIVGGALGGLGSGKKSNKSKSMSYSETNTTLFNEALLQALEGQGMDNVDWYSRLIQEAGGGYADVGLNKLASLVSEDGNIDVDAIMRAAKQESDQSVGQAYQDLSRSVGATDNSLVQAANVQNVTHAATDLAGKRAELEALRGEKTASYADALISGALDKDKLSLASLTSLFDTLKGARSKSVTTSYGVNTSPNPEAGKGGGLLATAGGEGVAGILNMFSKGG